MKRCPYCGTENAPDAPACKSCGTSLLAAPPELPVPGAEPEARSVVLRTFSSQMNAELVAQQLEAAGISAMLTADDAGGAFPSLHMAHGTRLLIKAADLAWAEQAMSEIEESLGVKAEGGGGDTGIPPGTPMPPQKPAPHLMKLRFLLIGLLLGALAHYGWTIQRSLYTGTQNEDLNGDGRPDAWRTYDSGEMVKFAVDRNLDGAPDGSWTYLRGASLSSEDDLNFDGKSDVWFTYAFENVTQSRVDFDFDGRYDAETRFVHGVPVESTFAISNQFGFWRRDFYTNGLLRVTHLDRDRDGTLDERHVYDAFGTFLRVEPMK